MPFGESKTAQSGDVAPQVTVPAVTREGMISLADYRDRAPVMLGLFRGLYCAFCRRHVASLGLASEPLRELGVETIAIVATEPVKARQYFSYQRPRCLVGADPELASHRAFGVPQTQMTNEIMGVIRGRTDELARQEGFEVESGKGYEALDRKDHIVHSDYLEDIKRHQAQFTAQFLIDRGGIIRWSSIECAKDGLAGLERMASKEELLAAARAL
jgi:peroxiredoxin